MSEQHLRDAFGRITPSDEAKQRMLDNILAAGEGAAGQTAAGETAAARQVAEQTTAPMPTPAVNQTLDVTGASDVVVPVPAKARKRSRFTAVGLSVAACLVVLAFANALILSPEFSEQLFEGMNPQANTSSVVGEATDAPKSGEKTDATPPPREEDSTPPVSTEPDSSGDEGDAALANTEPEPPKAEDEDSTTSEDIVAVSPLAPATSSETDITLDSTSALFVAQPEPDVDGWAFLTVLPVVIPLAAALVVIVCVLIRRRRD
jgi:disulfide bond formation protein DsbB